MMTRLLALSTLGLAAAIGPCQHIPKSIVNDALNSATDVQKTRKEAETKCEPLRKAKVTVDEETEIGGAVALNWASRGKGLMLGAEPLDELSRYLNRVGKNLASQSERPTLDWTFGVVDAEDFNAYSSPGGYVFVTRGLLKKIENEAQLAGVLAHEVAHVAHRDALEVYNSIKANQCIASAVGSGISRVGSLDIAMKQATGATGGVVDFKRLGAEVLGEFAKQMVDTLTTQGFAHEDEFDADQTAVELLISAGYDPNQFVAFLGKLPADGGAFRNHPSSEARRAKLTAHLKTLSAKQDGFHVTYDASSKEWKPVPLKGELAAVK
ncbi:MAG: M48 family metallopeptidase [Myxococcaceae bacterium]